MSYFTAVLAREGEKWFAHDLDVEDLDDIGELTVALREVAAAEEEPVLLLVEREDAWWAVVRVDADDDPRVFGSDLLGVAASPYAGVLAVEEPKDDEAEPGTPFGDSDLLADVGTTPETLAQICEDELVPMDALAALAEAGGFAEVLDSLR